MSNDLILEELILSGFMSYPPHKKQSLCLNTHTITTIIGEDINAGTGEKNGTGKSSLIHAIEYNLYGKTSRISNKGLINYIANGPLYTCTVNKKGPLWFRIERGENPSLLRLFEISHLNDKPTEDIWYTKNPKGEYLYETTRGTKPETTRRIIEILGFDIKLFDVLLVNNPSDMSCFFLKDEESQRNIIERIFGFTIFTEKANALREIRKEDNKTLIAKESALIATKEANDRIIREITQLETQSQTWINEKNTNLKYLTQQINSYKKIDFTKEISLLKNYETINIELDNHHKNLLNLQNNLNQINKQTQSWDTEHQNKINKLTTTIDILRNTNAESDIADINARVPLEKEILELTQIIKDNNNDILNAELLKNNTTVEIKKNISDINALEQQLITLSEAKCPTCGQEWHDNQSHMTHLVQELEQKQLQNTKLDTNLLKHEEKLKNLQRIFTKHNTKKISSESQLSQLPLPKTFSTITEAMVSKTQLVEKQQQLSQLISESNPHNNDDIITKIDILNTTIETLTTSIPNPLPTFYQTLKEAENNLLLLNQHNSNLELYKNSHNPYEGTIKNLRTNALKPVDETVIRDLKKKIEHLNLLITLLSDRDSPIRKQVLQEWLPRLNLIINENLQELELPHSITFSSDMTSTFHINDVDCTFNNLSNGQRTKSLEAVNLAFITIFELINYKINVLFIDEILDKGLSERGINVSYELLEKYLNKDKSIFLITHRQELVDRSNNTITITMEDKLSTIN